MLFFDSGGEGSFSLGVPAEKSGVYTLKIHYLRAPAYGKVQLYVNGKAVGDPVDLYRAFVDMFPRDIWPPKEYVFEGIALKKGSNEFRFSISDKNEEATGYRVGIDCIVLEEEK
jgi:hypothetical protein